MKRLLAVILCIFAFTMVSAAAEETITGEWYTKYFGLPMTMTLNNDGSAAVRIQGLDEEEGFTWNLDNEKFTLIKEETGTATEGKYNNGKITLAEENTTYDFSRDPVEAIKLAEADPTAAEESFDGNWEPAYIEKDGFLKEASEEDELTLPLVSIKNSMLAFEDDSEIFAFYFGTAPIQMTYENGKMSCLAAMENESDASALEIQAELLQDGTLSLKLDFGGKVIKLYSKQIADKESHPEEKPE